MTPVRTCVGCRQLVAADQLVRLAVVDGKVVVSRTAPGRGAWLHNDAECLDLAIKRRAFNRAFRNEVDASSLVLPG